jgi:hypothetical protein
MMSIMVAMYPFVGDRERDAALARITARHLRRDDTRWSEAGSDGDNTARDVLDYLRRHHIRLPRVVAAEDATDELVLAAWVWWDERRRERELLRRARHYGHSLGEIGAFLGLATRQATYEYLDRLEALLAAHDADQDRQQRVALERVAAQQAIDRHPRDPEVITGPSGTSVLPARADLYRRTRGRRPSTVGADPGELRARRRDRRALPTRERWITAHHQRIDQVVTELLAQCRRLGFEIRDQDSDEFELDDTLAVLARHQGRSLYTEATFGALGLALGELRPHPEVTALARNHGIHQAIAAADRLRADYASLTVSTTA